MWPPRRPEALVPDAVALEVVARHSGRPSTFQAALSVLLRRWPSRLAAQAAWLWLGWHLFVRVDWLTPSAGGSAGAGVDLV